MIADPGPAIDIARVVHSEQPSSLESPATGDLQRVKVSAFDMFGTVFDVHSVVEACRDAFGDEGDVFSQFWRREQLEYSWKRSLMDCWVPFWQITQDALDTTLEYFGRAGDDVLRRRLIRAYQEVSPFPDARPALDALAQAGVRCVILTNGSRDMVASALAAANFEHQFERIFSVDDVQVFKPDPRVYRMAQQALGSEPDEILMVSSHPWDLAGAISCGFQGVWIDRPGVAHHVERLGFYPHYRVADLGELATLLCP